MFYIKPTPLFPEPITTSGAFAFSGLERATRFALEAKDFFVP